jgi:hypothetical protein
LAYKRTGGEPWAWLKSVGSQDDPLKVDWTVDRDDYLMKLVFFAKHPRSIREGDILVYYAARHGALVGLFRVISDDVEHNPDRDRWQWTMEVRPVVTLPLRQAPTIYDTSIEPTRVRRQSHILLTEPEYSEIRDLIFDAAKEATALA